jgi:hypothetical protein
VDGEHLRPLAHHFFKTAFNSQRTVARLRDCVQVAAGRPGKSYLQERIGSESSLQGSLILFFVVRPGLAAGASRGWLGRK